MATVDFDKLWVDSLPEDAFADLAEYNLGHDGLKKGVVEESFEAGMRQNAMEYQTHDADQDNKLDFNEFCALVRERETGVHSDAELVKRFEALDGDKSGKVDLHEYVLWALRDALSRSSSRVLDLFRQWDEDGSGTVDRDEFRRAVRMMGFDFLASDTEVDMVFDSLDVDNSGMLEYKELNKQLRIGAGSNLDPMLQAGALGEISMESRNKYGLRSVQQGENLQGRVLKVTLDADADKTVQDQLRDALSAASVRVIDLFREWDTDGNGKVSRAEFHKAMAALQLEAPPEDIDQVFSSWDGDGSGMLELNELQKLLRRGGEVELNAKLQAGAMGEIETSNANKHALRRGQLQRKGSQLLQGFEVDMSPDKPIAEQLCNALSTASVRVIDLFREWDEDGNGRISRKEFHKALAELKMVAPQEEIDALFDLWDPDGSGTIEFTELHKLLRRGAAVDLDSSLQAGGAGEIEMDTVNKHALRGGRLQENKGSAVVHGFAVDESSDKSIAEQLRDALAASSARVVDLFREWDTDGNGKVSRAEFHKAMAELRFEVAAEDINALFDSWDGDGSGLLEMSELQKLLRPGADKEAGYYHFNANTGETEWRAGEGPKIEVSNANKFALRGGVLQRQGSMVLGNFDVDETSDKSVAEQLRDALIAVAGRAIDLFREWDTDGNGLVSREEFHRAMDALNFEAPAEEIDKLFDEWDPDGSGTLEMNELQKLMRREVHLSAKLQAGALGEIATEASNKHALRRGELRERQGSMVLHGFAVDESSDKPIAEQLRDALAASSARVVDLFREWDTDGNGKVSRAEFHKAMAQMRFEAPAEDIDKLFDAWDPDGSGLLELNELVALLKRGGSLQAAPEPRSPPQYALAASAQPAPPSTILPLTIGVLPPVVAPPKQANKPKLKPPPLCLEWDDAEGRYMSRAERLLGKQWRRRMHERNLFWDAASRTFVNKGQFFMNRAPGGEAAQESVVLPDKKVPRMGMACRGDAAHVLSTPAASVMRTLTPKKSRIGGGGWESQVLENRIRQFEAESEPPSPDDDAPSSITRDLLARLPEIPSPRPALPSRQIRRQARSMLVLHERSIHARFLSPPPR